MAPPETLDYLVIHELAHLHEMNHSKRFWTRVAQHCPDWKAHRRWLRDHSGRLKKAIRRAS
jgi:predicted metal-dependent hydrolase